MNALSWFIAGRIRLMTMSFSNPATLFWMARKSSAIPPVASWRRSVYLPNRQGSPSVRLAGALVRATASRRWMLCGHGFSERAERSSER